MLRSQFRVLLALVLLPALCAAQNPTNGGPVYPEDENTRSAPVQPADDAASDYDTGNPPSPAPASAGYAAPVPVKYSPEGFPILEDSTPIRLSLARTLSSGDSRTGDRVDFKVVEPIVLDGVTVVPRGGIAWGRIAEVKHKRRMARGGKLAIEIDSVKLANSNRVKLRAVRETRGGGHTALMGGAMVGTAIVFLPIAPVWLLMRGKEAKIREGTEITAYVNGDVVYTPPPGTTLPPRPSTPAPAATAAAPTAPPPPAAAAPEANLQETGPPYGHDSAMEASPGSTEIAFTSTPEGAQIELDGAFVGNTPSTIGVPGGEHTVRISKRGYRTYERRVRTSGGNIRLHGDLQPER